MADAPARSVVEVQEPELDGVKPHDKQLVREVIAALQVLQAPKRLIKGWAVNPCGTTHYEVLGHIDANNGEWEIYETDLDIIKQLDVRISTVAVRVRGVSQQIYVKIMSKDVPVMITECDVIRIQRKRRWAFM